MHAGDTERKKKQAMKKKTYDWRGVGKGGKEGPGQVGPGWQIPRRRLCSLRGILRRQNRSRGI